MTKRNPSPPDNVIRPWQWSRPPQLRLSLDDELIVDNFAGGGGASMGIEQAIGRPVDIAINHDPAALAMHEANHPHTKHFCEDVFDIDPYKVCGNRPVALMWASPDCTHFSKAKGGRPVSKKVRGLAWVVVRWARTVRPRVIICENVSEIQDWGPLTKDGVPCKKRKGRIFRDWVSSLERLGYRVDFRTQKASDFGAPTIRERLFVIARRDGHPIVWPDPTHGPAGFPYNTAASCIDWSIPCPSIFERPRPLAEKTMERIAKGTWRYVINSDDPFIAPGPQVWPGSDNSTLVAAFLAKHYGGVVGHGVDRPTGTITTKDHHSLVTSHLVKLRNNCYGLDQRTPLHTITTGGHFGEVRAFLVKYYGTAVGSSLHEPLHTVTTKARFGLVMIRGEAYQIADIGMRMLSPRELYRANGFPDSYIIDPMVGGKPLPKTQQIAKCGNSVPPPFARALVSANLGVSVGQTWAA